MKKAKLTVPARGLSGNYRYEQEGRLIMVTNPRLKEWRTKDAKRFHSTILRIRKLIMKGITASKRHFWYRAKSLCVKE